MAYKRMNNTVISITGGVAREAAEAAHGKRPLGAEINGISGFLFREETAFFYK